MAAAVDAGSAYDRVEMVLACLEGQSGGTYLSRALVEVLGWPTAPISPTAGSKTSRRRSRTLPASPHAARSSPTS